jgi:hypothetical protein
MESGGHSGGSAADDGYAKFVGFWCGGASMSYVF